MNIYEELKLLLKNLHRANVPYALCGGLAMAAHGLVRATEDIDLLIQGSDLPRVRTVAKELGFHFNRTPFTFKEGEVIIYRLYKARGEHEALLLDLLLVTPGTQAAWDTRQCLETEFGPVQVVSPAGLIHLKSLRRSGQDEDDIRRLKDLSNES